MATVRIESDVLSVELQGADVFWAVHGTFRIPLASVAGARTEKPPGFWSSLKLIGTNAPWLKMAGTFVYHGERVFFDYRGNEDAVLVVDLAGDQPYRHLFVHVDDPAAAAAEINARVGRAG